MVKDARTHALSKATQTYNKRRLWDAVKAGDIVGKAHWLHPQRFGMEAFLAEGATYTNIKVWTEETWRRLISCERT